MKEKVLNLLALCLQAKEVGEYINFEYHPGVDMVTIYSYSDYQQVLRALKNEQCPRKLDYRFYLDGEEEDTLEIISEIETEILKLIETAKAK